MSTLPYIAVGPHPARVLLVGEAPGKDEAQSGCPLVGSSGLECGRMLYDAGIAPQSPEQFFAERKLLRGPTAMRQFWLSLGWRITNVAHERPYKNQIDNFFYKVGDAKKLHRIPIEGRYPKDEIVRGLRDLEEEVRRTNPDFIIAMGGTALWALTGEQGIMRWRGSQIYCKWKRSDGTRIRLVPIIHPAAILRQWSLRVTTVHDLRVRVAPFLKPNQLSPEWIEPDTEYLIRPSFRDVMQWLDEWEDTDERAAVDRETRGGQTACISICWSPGRAICIPFLCVESNEGYWSFEEEYAIRCRLRHLLEVKPIYGQNFGYDEQYGICEEGVRCSDVRDTMWLQHVAWAGMPRALDFLSSIYMPFHRYWKDEGKTWSPGVPEEQLWIYNCKDSDVTLQVGRTLDQLIIDLNLEDVYEFQQYELYPLLLDMMLIGVRIDKKLRDKMILEVQSALSECEAWFERILGHPLNPRSNQQLAKLFFEDFGLRPIKYTDGGNPSTDKEVLKEIGEQDILFAPLTYAIEVYRSLGVLLSTFILAPLDPDGRIRCYYGPGTETYRLTSSENAFDRGTNLENIPKNRDDYGDKYTEQWRYVVNWPNIRELFLPDPGHIILDVDLARADAQVVAWEANDEVLKQMFREGVDIHEENARAIGKPFTRDDAKRGVHAANYGVTARTLAKRLGVTVHQADMFIRRWYGAHPQILRYINKIRGICEKTPAVAVNKFGYRRVFFERPGSFVKEYLAWIPQSTVAIVTNRGLCKVRRNLPWVEILLQNHDSGVLQIPRECWPDRHLIRDQMLITVPYDDPLVIPVGLKASEKSWGHAHAEKEKSWHD